VMAPQPFGIQSQPVEAGVRLDGSLIYLLGCNHYWFGVCFWPPVL
jgi:hypothetical protein